MLECQSDRAHTVYGALGGLTRAAPALAIPPPPTSGRQAPGPTMAMQSGDPSPAIRRSERRPGNLQCAAQLGGPGPLGPAWATARTALAPACSGGRGRRVPHQARCNRGTAWQHPGRCGGRLLWRKVLRTDRDRHGVVHARRHRPAAIVALFRRVLKLVESKYN